jgi:transcriptional regulator with XRE-family HTH domain
MADSSSQFREGLSARVKLAREAAGFTQEEMALILGVTQTRLSKWEGARKSQIPHELMQRFCLATRVSIEWLITGEGPGPRPIRRRERAA